MNENQHGYSSDENNTEGPFEDYKFTAIQEANEENEENEEKSLRQKKAVLKMRTVN